MSTCTVRGPLVLALALAAATAACATDSPVGNATRETLPNGAVLVRYPDLPAIDSVGPEVTEVPWTTRMPFPVAHEDLIVGYGRWAELRTFGPDGRLERIARWHAEPEPITGEDRQRFEDEKAACEARYQTRCRALDDFTWLPSHKFFFDKLVLDADGNISARSVSPTSLGSSDSSSSVRGEPAGPERRTVLGSSGKWLGTVQMPEGLALAQVANGRVYGVYRDELGVATVRVHLVERNGSAS